MYLKSVTLRDWGCHDNLPVIFEEGLNICIGPNGAGKSTLYHAIVSALTLKHNTKDQKAQAFKSWGRDGYGPTALMEIVRDDGVWSLTKTFLHSPQCLLERNHGDAAPSRFKGSIAEQELDRWLERRRGWAAHADPLEQPERPGPRLPDDPRGEAPARGEPARESAREGRSGRGGRAVRFPEEGGRRAVR